jgi:hypothetical protein
MFIFAHVVAGALIGLGFWHLAHDRRMLPLGILGAILPDLLDKPLACLFPDILGSGRTLGHTLLFVGIIAAAGLLLWHYRLTLAGLAFSCAVFSHQILDAMWGLPSTWLYPILGPFPVFSIPDYAGHYFWLEIASLSEWVFAGAAVIIVGIWYLDFPEHQGRFLSECSKTVAQTLVACLLGVMGVYLLVSGLAAIPTVFFAPTYNQLTCIMAGILSFSGSIALVKWSGIRSVSPD